MKTCAPQDARELFDAIVRRYGHVFLDGSFSRIEVRAARRAVRNLAAITDETFQELVDLIVDEARECC